MKEKETCDIHSSYLINPKTLLRSSTSFMNISNADDRLEIGSTWVGKIFKKTGLNRNCKYLLLQFAFDNIGAESKLEQMKKKYSFKKSY